MTDRQINDLVFLILTTFLYWPFGLYVSTGAPLHIIYLFVAGAIFVLMAWIEQISIIHYLMEVTDG